MLMDIILIRAQSFYVGFAEASHRAVTTLSFVAPELVVPEIAAQIRRDIDAQELKAVTEEDLAIWATPEGTAYIDGKHSRHNLT